MTALMSDIIEERISPNVANAAINAGGKLLKVVEMQYKYNRPRPLETNEPRPAFELGGVS
jgi:pantothenate kinase